MTARRGVRALLLLATVAYTASVLPGTRSDPGYAVVWEVGVYNLVLLCTLGLCVLRAVSSSAGRATWVLFACGLGSYLAGTLVFSLWLQPMDQMPYPSVADALWLGVYPFALAGTVLAARRGIAGSSRSRWFDGLTVGLGLAAVGAVLLSGHLTVGAGSFTAVLVNLAYPVLDLALAGCAVGAMAALGAWRHRTWSLLGGGFVMFATADSWYLAQVAADTYRAGSLVDATWAVAMCLVGLAAAARPVPTPAAPSSSTESRSFVLPAVFAAGSIVVLAADAFVRVSPVSTVSAVAALAAAFWRSVRAVRDVVGLAESRRQARTDPLTGLPNRRVIYELLERHEPAAGRPGALLLIDLDRFKEVNDALGHRTGDDLLRAVAARLGAHVPDGATLARLGGDEFAVVMPDADAATATALAARLRAALQTPFTVAGMTLHADASIGVTVTGDGTGDSTGDSTGGSTGDDGGTGGADQADLDLARADLAMYRAKAARTGVELYDDARDGDAWNRLAIVEDLRDALAAGDLHLELQPILALPSRTPAGVEALVRWTHPTRGRLAPDEFLPMVERAGLMGTLTRYVLDRALDEAVALRRAGWCLPVAVNLSASDLLDPGLVDVVAAGLGRRSLPGSALHLEITESLLVEDRDVSDAILRRLRTLGVQVAVDDFGTGYSSLAYLRDLPVDVLKIDRSFIHQLHADDRTPTIVASTITLAHDLGLRVVAEGVETVEELDWLDRHGCDTVQGYLLGRPMTPERLREWLDARPRTSDGPPVVPARRATARVVA